MLLLGATDEQTQCSLYRGSLGTDCRNLTSVSSNHKAAEFCDGCGSSNNCPMHHSTPMMLSSKPFHSEINKGQSNLALGRFRRHCHALGRFLFTTQVHRVHTKYRKWSYMTFQDFFVCIFQDFPGPLLSIFHVFPGLFNPVDIEQVGFSYNTEYVTQFIITLNTDGIV